MKKPLYMRLAELVASLSYKMNQESPTAQDEIKERIESLVYNYMPSGSGIDSGTQIDLDKSSNSKLVFNTSYHHIDEGMYVCWTEHKVTVTPSFINRLDIKVSGRNRNEICNYLEELFYDALMCPVE